MRVAGVFGGRAGNMCNRQSEDIVAAVAAAGVKGDGALVVGLAKGRYGEAERGRENSVTIPSTRRLRLGPIPEKTCCFTILGQGASVESS